MHFVNDVNFIARLGWGVLHVFNDLFTNVVNTRFRGGIHLDDIETGSFANGHAESAGSAGVGGWTLFAVQGTGE